MRSKRAQAAMEFLMTYGWAILVVLAAIGALAYFGILSPDKLLPNTFTVSGGFSPGEAKVQATGGILMSVVNNLGGDATSVNVTMNTTGGTSPACNEVNTTYAATGLANGQETALMNFCSSNTYSANDKFKADITVSYIRAGQQLTHEAKGSMTRNVE